MTITLNQIIFFPAPKSEYFVQQHWESEYFFLETPPPPYIKSLGESKKFFITLFCVLGVVLQTILDAYILFYLHSIIIS
jgi:hypothetical protein